MAVTVQVEGTKELAALLRKIGDKDLQKALRGAHLAASRLVVGRAKTQVPVRSGNLQRSIRSRATQRAAIVVAGSPKRAPYGPAIEFGRKRGNVGRPPGNHKGENVVPAHPFLRPAGEQVAPLALLIYKRDIARVLERASASGSV